MVAPSLLCPIDFSDGSRGALRYAGAIAAHFGARLTLLAVNDPLLYEALELAGGEPRLDAATARELQHFFGRTFGDRPHGIPDVRVEVVAGRPAPEILRASREHRCDMIVMSSHGATGFRKLFFGSTTERVLRDTTVPVLVTPGEVPGPARLEDVPSLVRRVLVPVDLSTATAHQLRIARGVAEGLGLPLLVLHVVEPVRASVLVQSRLPGIEAERRDRAERQLDALVDAMPPRIRAEALVAYGESAEEIAKVAASRDAGLIVMGLHSSPVLGPRMGSVTYRVLCLAHQPILALPPAPADAEDQPLAESAGTHRA
jgi:nucleotide-binding universal stress UspA family protein